MSAVAGTLVHLRCLRLGNILRVYSTYALTLRMDRKHDLGGLFPAHAEKLLQYLHHKLHRGVIIVQENHSVEGRFLELRFGGRNSQITVVVILSVSSGTTKGGKSGVAD